MFRISISLAQDNQLLAGKAINVKVNGRPVSMCMQHPTLHHIEKRLPDGNVLLREGAQLNWLGVNENGAPEGECGRTILQREVYEDRVTYTAE